MSNIKCPPKVHTDFQRAELLIESLIHYKNIHTTWGFMKSSESCNDWMIRGSAQTKKDGVGIIDLQFHPYLFDPELPEPYYYGNEIDIAAVSVISHEAGHILDDRPHKYKVKDIDYLDLQKQPKETKMLILDIEQEAWEIGEALVLDCCMSYDNFNEGWKWDLYHDIKKHCLGTYRKGMGL